jgi:hypothetical protein
MDNYPVQATLERQRLHYDGTQSSRISAIPDTGKNNGTADASIDRLPLVSRVEAKDDRRLCLSGAGIVVVQGLASRY